MFQDILTKKIEERKREKDEEGEKRGFFFFFITFNSIITQMNVKASLSCRIFFFF